MAQPKDRLITLLVWNNDEIRVACVRPGDEDRELERLCRELGLDSDGTTWQMMEGGRRVVVE